MPPTVRALTDANKELRRPFHNALANVLLEGERGFMAPFLYLGGKASRIHASILRLCEAKMGFEAAMLSRALFETSVTAVWLASDPAERVAMYYGAIVFTMRDANKKAHRYANEFPRSFDELAAGKQWIAANEKEFTERFGKRRSGSWGPVTISEMAKEIGATKYYDIVYGVLSDLEHSGPAGMGFHLQQRRRGEFNLAGGADTGWLVSTLQIAHPFLLLAMDAVDSVLELGLEHHLAMCRERWAEILPNR